MVLSRKLTVDVSRPFDGMLGLAPWSVKVGYASFLTLEFGKEVVTRMYGKEHTHGEWHLWLECCSWRIQAGSRLLIGSGDARTVLERTIKRMTFGPLSSARLDAVSLDLALSFEAGIELVTFTNHRYRYVQWHLFRPDGGVLVAGAGGRLAQGTTSKDQGRGRRGSG